MVITGGNTFLSFPSLPFFFFFLLPSPKQVCTGVLPSLELEVLLRLWQNWRMSDTPETCKIQVIVLFQKASGEWSPAHARQTFAFR